MNVRPDNQAPFVGRSAFAHKGGIHVSAILKNSKMYEHIDPKTNLLFRPYCKKDRKVD